MVEAENRFRRSTIALGVLAFLSVVCAGLLFAKYEFQAIRIARALDQVEIFDSMRKKALASTGAEAADCLEYVVGYYPSGTRHPSGSRLDKTVECARRTAISAIIADLWRRTGRSTSDDAETWIACLQQSERAGQVPVEGREFTASVPSKELLDSSMAVFAFSRSKHHPALIFARTGTHLDRHRRRPRTIILVMSGKAWKVFDLNLLDRSSSWVHACCARDSGRIWAIGDLYTAGPSWELEIVFSPDGGSSWTHLASVRKPFYVSHFNSFRMGLDGKGTLIVRADDDYGGGVSVGYYEYTTADWGRSWSKPRYSPDILCDADYAQPPVESSVVELMEDLSKR